MVPGRAWAKDAPYHDMTKAEQDALNAKWDAEAKPGYKNCMREYDDVKHNGPPWTGPPSLEDCKAWSAKLKEKTDDAVDEALKGFMETK